MLPKPAKRLRFREMADADLDVMAQLLGDPYVMRFYPRPYTREEAQRWIDWNQDNYQRYGHGLWIVETLEGTFVGDCGLTWQTVEGTQHLEVGYHTVEAMQGRGYATEAARACIDFAAVALGADHAIAIINPDNGPSQRVAQKVGLRLERTAEVYGLSRAIYGSALPIQKLIDVVP